MKLFIELKENVKEVKLLYPGKFNHGLYGDFEVTEKDLQHAVENFQNHKGVRLDENGSPELPANYQHSGGDKNPENAKAAGWIKSLFVKNNSLYANIEWTEKALEYINKKEFKYISPEFSHDWQDENGEKHGFTVVGVALTNIPFLKKGMQAISLTEDSVLLGEYADYVNEEPVKLRLRGSVNCISRFEEFLYEKINDGGIKTFDDLMKTIDDGVPDLKTQIKNRFNSGPGYGSFGRYNFTEKNGAKLMDEKQIRQLMGLDENADILGTIKALQEAKTKSENKVKDLELKNAELTEKNNASEIKLAEATSKIENAEKNLTDSEKQVKELSEKVTEIEKKMVAKEADQAITQFIESGKVLPKQKDFWMKRYIADCEGTEKYLNDATPVIEFGEKGSAGDAEEKKEYKDPTQEVNDRAKKLMEEKKISMKDAVNQVISEDKELKEAYFDSYKS